MLSFVFLVIGFALMIWGADKFVAGASALARKLGVSPLLIGLTIVAFGTSMPELAVSVTAALRGANEIAVGNVVGSNIFNLLMVAGLSAAVCPLVMDKTLLRRDWPLSILAAVLLLGAIVPDLTIARWEGVVLLIIFAFILTDQIRTALQNRSLIHIWLSIRRDSGRSVPRIYRPPAARTFSAAASVSVLNLRYSSSNLARIARTSWSSVSA